VVCAASAGVEVVPWALSDDEERAILHARERTNWGPMWLAGRHRSTCWKVLHRHGCSRQRRSAPRQTGRHYEWTEAGALLHIDAMERAKFDRPGHWAHGDRSEPHRTRKAGRVKVIGVIEDHTRLACCEIHAAENAHTVSATLRRAALWMREQGCGPVQAVMSDNAKCYATSHEFRRTLTELGARHILIPPRTPRWNGEIERSRHPGHRMGTRPRLAHQHPPRPRPGILSTLLQPQAPALSRRRPTTHHPRPPSPQAGHLGRRGSVAVCVIRLEAENLENDARGGIDGAREGPHLACYQVLDGRDEAVLRSDL
jgi:Integrase core domain